MTLVDKLYIDTVKKIKEYGFDEAKVKGSKVRPHWEDGSPAYTRYLPQAFFSYKAGQTPITNLRKIAWKSAIKEILWIYQDKSNDVNLLKDKYGVGYWDSWKDAEGSLGTSYGYQMGKKIKSPETGQMTDQVDRLLYNISHQPLNRRHIMTMIDMDDMADMTLVPCAFMTLWTVAGSKLNLTLIQRSGDFMAASSPGGINSIQYYALLLMVARHTGYEPGDFLHFVQNLHIYDRHMDIVDQVIKNDKSYPEPKLRLREGVKDFYDITIDDFIMEDYRPDETKYNIPIAL